MENVPHRHRFDSLLIQQYVLDAWSKEGILFDLEQPDAKGDTWASVPNLAQAELARKLVTQAEQPFEEALEKESEQFEDEHKFEVRFRGFVPRPTPETATSYFVEQWQKAYDERGMAGFFCVTSVEEEGETIVVELRRFFSDDTCCYGKWGDKSLERCAWKQAKAEIEDAFDYLSFTGTFELSEPRIFPKGASTV